MVLVLYCGLTFDLFSEVNRVKKHLLCMTFAFLGFSATVSAGTYSDDLSRCIYKNMTSSDKSLVIQWTYVELSKTKAARQVAVIPDAKVKSVESEAKKTLTRIIGTKCSKEVAKVALHEPKTGIKATVGGLVSLMIEDELKKRSSTLLSSNVFGGNTELLQQGSNLIQNFLRK